MTGVEHARDLAEEHFNSAKREGERSEVDIYEFDEGYVAWIRQPEPEDPAALPSVVGGSCIVIDKQTARLHVRPLLDPESVAKNYRQSKAEGRL